MFPGYLMVFPANLTGCAHRVMQSAVGAAHALRPSDQVAVPPAPTFYISAAIACQRRWM